MHAYETNPIDFGWEHLQTVWEVAARLGQEEAQAAAQGGAAATNPTLAEFLAGWKQAQDSAAAVGWDGAFRHEPRVIWLPEDGRFAPGFVIKQDTDGTTYVATPHPLPHLEER
jgi:hypothetical protein